MKYILGALMLLSAGMLLFYKNRNYDIQNTSVLDNEIVQEQGINTLVTIPIISALVDISMDGIVQENQVVQDEFVIEHTKDVQSVNNTSEKPATEPSEQENLNNDSSITEKESVDKEITQSSSSVPTTIPKDSTLETTDIKDQAKDQEETDIEDVKADAEKTVNNTVEPGGLDHAYEDSSVSHFYKNSSIKEDILTYLPSAEQKQILYVTSTLLGAEDKRVLKSTDYTKEESILVLKKEFLEQLSNAYYYIDVSLSDGNGYRLTVKIHGEDEERVPVLLSLESSRYEYSKADGNSIYCVLRNANGKRIDYVRTKDSVMNKDDYQLLFDKNAIKIDSETMDKYINQESIVFTLVLDDGTSADINVKITERKLVYPKPEVTDFRIDKDQPTDIVIPMTWNDYPKMLNIHPLNKDERIPDNYWYQTENSIIIKKEYLSNHDNGIYTWMLEFGDVGCGIKVTIFGGI